MGEGGHLALVSICALVSIYFYKLTVLNGKGGHLTLVSICALVCIYSYIHLRECHLRI